MNSFVNYWHTDRSHMVVLLFMVCVLYIISKWYVVILMDNQDGGATDLGATPVEWSISYHDAQDGDQVQEGPYHITLFMHVMLILLCVLFCLDRDGSIIRWSLSLNIKIIMCSSLVCTVKKVHRFETPRDDRVWQTQRSHTTGADEPSMYIHGLGTHAILWFYLESLACTYMASKHVTER